MHFFQRVVVPVWLFLLTVLLGFQFWEGRKAPTGRSDFQEINVERLNIVEPDGRYRVVLANSARFPGLFMDGIEYRHFNRTGGGFLFFNDDGDEVGGMLFNSSRSESGHSASAGLMFDQYKQDQTVGLQYQEGNGRRTAGLRVWDRPDYSIQPIMEYSDRAARAETREAREDIIREMREFAVAQGGSGAERLFAGKQQEEAIVKLADKEGRPRLVLKVDALGVPSVEFLDQDGKVTRRIGE